MSTGGFRRGLRHTLVGAVAVAAISWGFGSTVGAGTTSTSSTTAPVAPAVIADPVGPFGYTNGPVFAGGGAPTCRFYKVALGNGVGEQLGTGLPCADGYTFDSAGVLYAYTSPVVRGAPITTSKLVTVSLADGTQTIVGDLGHTFFDGGMTFDKDGKLWLYADTNDQECSGESCLYSVNPSTGATALVGDDDEFLATGLAADCTTVYATGAILDGQFTSDALWTVNTATGDVTKIGSSLGLNVFTSGLDFASDGTLYTIGSLASSGPLVNGPRTATVDKTNGVGSNLQTWTSEDPVPGFVNGLAVSGLSCPAAVTTPGIQPNFTG